MAPTAALVAGAADSDYGRQLISGRAAIDIDDRKELREVAAAAEVLDLAYDAILSWTWTAQSSFGTKARHGSTMDKAGGHRRIRALPAEDRIPRTAKHYERNLRRKVAGRRTDPHYRLGRRLVASSLGVKEGLPWRTDRSFRDQPRHYRE